MLSPCNLLDFFFFAKSSSKIIYWYAQYFFWRCLYSTSLLPLCKPFSMNCTLVMKSWIVLLLSLIVIIFIVFFFSSCALFSLLLWSAAQLSYWKVPNYLCWLYLILGLSEGFSTCILMQIISSYFESDCDIVK